MLCPTIERWLRDVSVPVILSVMTPAAWALDLKLGHTRATHVPHQQREATTIEHKLTELFKAFRDTGSLDALSEALALTDALAAGDAMSPEGEERSRTERSRAYLKVLGAAESKIIPNFDFRDLPSLATSPPPATGLPAGVDPVSIADPRLRAEYEQSVAADREKVAHFAFQKKLLKLSRKIAGRLEAFLNTEYSGMELDRMEVLTLFKEAGRPMPTRSEGRWHLLEP